MRLGEMLVQKGVITPEQLQTALHEQRRFGGRLGTNLIQLGYTDADTVALALSEKLALPPVLREHISSIDKRTLALFPGQIVSAHKAIPIGYTLTKPVRAVVACLDPATLPMEELAFAAGRRIELWIAPEATIQECMERYFGAAPIPPRYVSVKFAVRDPVSQGALRALSASAQLARTSTPAGKPSVPSKPGRSTKRALSPPPPPPSAKSAPRTLELPDLPLPVAPPVPRVSAMPVAPVSAPPEDPPRGEVDIRGWSPEPPPSIPEPSAPEAEASGEELPSEGDWDLPDEPRDAPAEPRPVTAPPDALRPVITRGEASMLLEMATSKEQIGRALEDWLRSAFGCGLVLVVKGEMAIGWKGFFPDAEDLVDAVAIPLGKPSMFKTAMESLAPFRGAPPEEGAKVHARLWKLMRCEAPTEALVCPVAMGKRVVNLVYAHVEDGSAMGDAAVEEAKGLCGEAAEAYARLIGRDKRR